jgi:hypothetical protein
MSDNGRAVLVGYSEECVRTIKEMYERRIARRRLSVEQAIIMCNILRWLLDLLGMLLVAEYDDASSSPFQCSLRNACGSASKPT